MPNRAALLLFSPLLFSACALLPQATVSTPPAATAADVAQLLDQQFAKEREANKDPLCQIPDFAAQFAAHNQQLNELNEQVNVLLQSRSVKTIECSVPEKRADVDGKLVIGAIEWVYLNPPGHSYLARVDSGATTSSISVQNLVRFERNGKKWVRFDIKPENEDESIEVEAPVERNVRIRQASASEADRRPAILMNVKLGSLQVETEFTLTDRSQMSYPMLLGRSFLQDMVLIDVSKELTQPKYEPEKTPAQPVKALPAPAVKPPASKPEAAPVKPAVTPVSPAGAEIKKPAVPSPSNEPKATAPSES